MKRLHLSLFTLVISIVSFNCQKEVSFNGTGIPGTNNSTSPITATLQGNILDENDQPAAAVQITVGSKNSVTNSEGYFRIVDAALDKNVSFVVAEKSGYFKAFRTFSATSGVNQVVIKLIKKKMAGTIDAETGGDISLPNGAKILLPAKGVITESSGTPYTGSINVYASYISPKSADIAQIVPGSFMANDKNNKRVSLISYGMMGVVLESTSGEKLQIAKSNKAKLIIPIPTSLQSSAPSTISLWYMDEHTGLWKEEGTATKNGDNYEGDVQHFSFWNADFGGPAVAVSMTLTNQLGYPLVYANVSIMTSVAGNDTTGNSGVAHGFTDSLGQVRGLVPANRNLIMQVTDQCGRIIYSQNIGPFSQNTDLGEITVGNASSVITIHGKLSDCSNAVVSDGYVMISYDHIIHYAATDNNGNFSSTFVTCSTIPASCEIVGINNATRQQGQTINVSLASPEIDAGNILACGISTLEYINYKLDGTDYSISNTSGNDSLIAYTYASPTPALFTTYILGSRSAGNSINFYFNHNGSQGIFPVYNLSVMNFNRIQLTEPFNVTVTGYPQSIGEYYEGNFSGQFKDSVNLTPLHTIDCSFRIQKRY